MVATQTFRDVEYTYDALGRRVRKVITNTGLSWNITNGETNYIYDSQQCVEERDDTEAPTRQYVWGLYIDELIQLHTYFPTQNREKMRPRMSSVTISPLMAPS